MTKAGKTPDATPDATPEPAADAGDADKARTDRRKVDGRWVAAAGMGIGSAAIVAALLYTNRNGRDPKTPK